MCSTDAFFSTTTAYITIVQILFLKMESLFILKKNKLDMREVLPALVPSNDGVALWTTMLNVFKP
jgi:hypothetical protein